MLVDDNMQFVSSLYVLPNSIRLIVHLCMYQKLPIHPAIHTLNTPSPLGHKHMNTYPHPQSVCKYILKFHDMTMTSGESIQIIRGV